jgi:hypothetical protein
MSLSLFPAISRLAKTPVDLTEEVVYQVPSGGVASINQFVLCNTSSSNVTINLAITAGAATSTATSDRIFSEMALAGNETMMISADIILLSGEKVWASASVDDVINLFMSGIEQLEEVAP